MNQKTEVVDYLQQHGSITPLEALRELGCFRLAARIKDLENEGFVIPREPVVMASQRVNAVGKKTGRRVRFTRYLRPVVWP